MKNDVDERALTIMVPEAEAFVCSFRAEYGHRADGGVPAHITVNHPFCPAVAGEEQMEEKLAGLFSRMAAFTFALTEVRRFPAALYLAPEPEEPFKQLIAAVAARFPESPPYEGKFTEIIPHLTVAYLEDEQEIEVVGAALAAAAAKALPITAEVRNVQLIEKVGNVWRERRSFQLQG